MFMVSNLKQAKKTGSSSARSVLVSAVLSSGFLTLNQSEHEPTDEQSAVMLSSHNETNTSLGQESSILAHKQLLRALYHVPFDLPKDPSDSVERTLKDLVAITDMYECRSVVDLSIQTHLLHFKTNETFLARCVRNPAEMLDFAILTRCNWMFVEVFVHLLSNDSLWDHHQTIIRKHGLERLFERKIASYQSLVKDVVLRIVSTVGVCHDTESYEVNIGRMFFQQQLAALLQNRFTDSPVLVIEALVNKKLLQFEYGWLASLETFTNRFAKGRIAESKKAYKDCLAEASVIASELLVNPCKVDTKFLDGACSPITRLLCFTITEDELPWNQKLS